MAFRGGQESEALGAVMMIYFTFNINGKIRQGAADGRQGHRFAILCSADQIQSAS